ncbi:MAG: cell division ATP-binding protein FtsE [Myxococcota bacterium]|nr:cell division ATP-binding protein FtsE [Myxococcota bacterium]
MIRLFHVSKRYTQDSLALDDVSLQIEKGGFSFLTGHSGAGKSTLMRLLFAAEKPTSGQVIVAGQNIGQMKADQVPQLRRKVSFIFQDFKLLERRTVFGNVAISLEILGYGRRLIAERVRGVLRDVGLEHRSKAMPARLSGGEQQRVAIARALVTEPLVLLADEPTGNLDPALSIEVMRLLESVNARGTTVLVTTHDHQLLKTFQKRVLTLDRGRLVGDRQ